MKKNSHLIVVPLKHIAMDPETLDGLHDVRSGGFFTRIILSSVALAPLPIGMLAHGLARIPPFRPAFEQVSPFCLSDTEASPCQF